MAEAQETQNERAFQVSEDGIVGFYAESGVSRDYQPEKFGIHYRFAKAVNYIDAVQRFDEIQQLATEHANGRLDQRLAQSDAAKVQASPAPAPQAPVASEPPRAPHPAEAEAAVANAGGQLVDGPPAGGLPVQVGTSPKGSQVRYVPSSALPSRAFEDVVKTQIRELGFDPDEFIVFDNRTTREGAKFKGLEDGGQNYSAANVQAKNDTTAKAMIEKAAFYVDFTEDGKVLVKASPAAEAYQKAQAAFA